MSGGIDDVCSSPSRLILIDVNTFSLENFGDRAVVPALTLPLGRYLHGIQVSSDGVGAHALMVHLFDGGDGSLLSFVFYGFATDLPPTVGIPSRTAVI